MEREERVVAEILLGIKAVALRLDPPYRWASGILSPIYTDNRLILSYPAERNTIVDYLTRSADKTCGGEIDVVAGVATSGIPWAALLAARMGKPLIYARPAPKDHGKENLIEGVLREGQNVLVIEDLISTGGSSVSVVNAVRAAGGRADRCLAIFTYEMKKADDAFRAAGCRPVALTGFSTLVKVAAEMGCIDRESMEKVLEWSGDPEGWGGRYAGRS